MIFEVKEGDYAKMGAQIDTDSVIFTFEGEKEDSCFVVLIHKKTKQKIRIEVPAEYCLGSLRSVRVAGFDPLSYMYLYEINGVEQIDPYVKAVCGRDKWNDLTRAEDDYKIYGCMSLSSFDWSDDHQPEIPKKNMIMYKLHARGFTMDHGVSKDKAGTFLGIQNRLDYLAALGITTIELMPIYEFEELIFPKKHELPDYIKWEKKADDIVLPEKTNEAKQPGLNYWGYTLGNYFAVKASYAKNAKNAATEYKEFIHNMHKRGMECIMEMYFPSTVNHNLILESLRFWVREFHVDGFHLIGDRLPITAIVQDVLLSRTKIFYEDFENISLKNTKKYKNLFVYKEEYLYPARKILNHINGDLVEFINQQKKQGDMLGYVNFLAGNNGFSLADVFMYNDRHNEANGENNEDGNPWNFSSNYGIEGPTRKKYILAMRLKQWKNAMMMLFLAQGVPLIWNGDEMLNSQNGNNNAYCQDNAIGWLNWKNEKKHKDQIAFVKKLIVLRKNYEILSNDMPFHFNDYKSLGAPDLSYHGENAWISGIDNNRMNVGLLYYGAYSPNEHKENIYVAYNFYSAVSTLALPRLDNKKKWYILLDSSSELIDENEKLVSNQQNLSMNPQSICVLVGK